MVEALAGARDVPREEDGGFGILAGEAAAAGEREVTVSGDGGFVGLDVDLVCTRGFHVCYSSYEEQQSSAILS